VTFSGGTDINADLQEAESGWGSGDEEGWRPRLCQEIYKVAHSAHAQTSMLSHQFYNLLSLWKERMQGEAFARQ
jgi:hypothetical protein